MSDATLSSDECHCRVCVGDHAGHGPCTLTSNERISDEYLQMIHSRVRGLLYPAQATKDMLSLLGEVARLRANAHETGERQWESMRAAIAREIDATKDPATKHRLIALHANSTPRSPNAQGKGK